ncbi:MAG TPA: hypothetical protein VGH27_03295 [Streptosporangiaceae bacterium]
MRRKPCRRRWGRWVEDSVYHARWFPGQQRADDLAAVVAVSIYAIEQEESSTTKFT